MYESLVSHCLESLEIGENGESPFDDWKSLVPGPNFADGGYEEMVAPKAGSEEVNFGTEEGGGGGGGSGIADRRDDQCGFNAAAAAAAGISSARFRSASPLTSPYLTISPGISPTALLTSSVMLPNSETLPSPTTGTYTLSHHDHENLVLNSEALAADGDNGSDFDSSRIEPHDSPISSPQGSAFQIQPPRDFEFPAEFPKEAATENCATDSSSEENVSEDKIQNASGLALHRPPTNVNSDQNLLVGDEKEAYPPVGAIRTSEDGYNWRKYGQKQVKGSEYPRSYYKCTHPNCVVKKKVERSHDGQITEIIYNSAHNHAKPQPNRRLVIGSPYSFGEMSEMADEIKSSVKIEGGVVCRNSQMGCKDFKIGSDWRTDGLDMTSTSVVSDISDPLSTTQGKSISMLESTGTPELSSTLASHDDDDGVTGISPGDDADDEEPELKRNFSKKDSYPVETNLTSRAVREPRVVVEIESEVDILEDGYRWRKYGQKVVKGNPNPRSYYKCTSPGCIVRKHVERASHNLKFIITTYEGRHNHEVPVGRNNTHASSGGGAAAAAPLAAASNTEPLARNPNVQKPDSSHVQDLALHFERRPEMGNELMRSGLLGNYGNDMRFGAAAAASSLYQMKYPPPYQNTMPFGGSFVLNPSHPSSSIAQDLPDFPIQLPSTIPQPTNMTMGGYGFNNNGKAIGPSRSFLGDQQLKEYDSARLVKPKLEQKEDGGVYGGGACPSYMGQGDAYSRIFSGYMS